MSSSSETNDKWSISKRDQEKAKWLCKKEAKYRLQRKRKIKNKR